MSAHNKLAVVIACCAMLGAPVAASADGYMTYHRPYHCSVHRTAAGSLVDCHGWRLRSTAAGWDNSCFKLDYLRSAEACSAGGE